MAFLQMGNRLALEEQVHHGVSLHGRHPDASVGHNECSGIATKCRHEDVFGGEVGGPLVVNGQSGGVCFGQQLLETLPIRHGVGCTEPHRLCAIGFVAIWPITASVR